jgi:hypothetical protein
VQLAHFFDLATALLVSYNIVQGGFFMKNEYYDTSLTMALIKPTDCFMNMILKFWVL